MRVETSVYTRVYTFVFVHVLIWSQVLFLHGSIIAFSVSILLEKGSGCVYRTYSVFTLINVLITQLSLWPHALKRWFFMLRDEMEFDEVASLDALSLHLLK